MTPSHIDAWSLDGKYVYLDEFLEANKDGLTTDDYRAILALSPGEEYQIGVHCGYVTLKREHGGFPLHGGFGHKTLDSATEFASLLAVRESRSVFVQRAYDYGGSWVVTMDAPVIDDDHSPVIVALHFGHEEDK
jgi:hypothetical protein